MKIALIRPRCDYAEPEFQEPLGAEAVCGYLRAAGLDCRVFDRLLGATTADLEAWGPDWVGFSLLTEADLADALRLLQLLRAPGRRFFAGGLFVTTEPERVRAAFPADTALIPGEGERAVLSLVTGKAYPGLCAPDEWAFASRDDLDAYLRRGGVIMLRSARGCHGACAFCTMPGRTPEERRFSARSAALVAEEMASLCRAGYPPVFNFTDDEFGPADRVAELISELERRDVRAAFSLEMRAAELVKTPPERWKALAAGGLSRVFTGLESFDPETLRRWNKPVDPAALLRAVEAMRRSGIVCELGYILWHPDSTPESVSRETEQLHAAGLLSPKSALSRLALFPGSALHRASGLRCMRLAPLKPEAERLFRQWETLLEPLMPVWIRAALRLPGAACRARLDGTDGTLAALTDCIARIGELTYAGLRDKRRPGAEEIAEIGGMLDALCGAGE